MSSVVFSNILRSETIPVGPDGEIDNTWYDRGSKDLCHGWTASMEWKVPDDTIWSARDLIEAFDMFTLSPLTIRSRTGRTVVVNQKVTMLSKDFPAMWVAQKISGKVD
jgi:hypothetical protein